MIAFVNWKIFRRTLIPFQESYVELAACLAVFFLALVCVAVKSRRQSWRHIVQGVSVLVFFFVVRSCLGVFGLIRNAFHGASLIGKDDLNAFYFLSMTVVILSVALHSGAIFCGWICPTGTMQEVVGKGRRLFQKKKTHVVLGSRISLLTILAGMGIFVWFVYRIFGNRRPLPEDSAVLWVTSLVVISSFAMLFSRRERALRNFRVLSLAFILFSIFLGISVYSPVHFIYSDVRDWASELSTIAIVSSAIWVSRAWCRYLCPFGYVCSQLNRVALRRVVVSPGCSECDRCGQVCEVGAIERGKLNSSACIMCLACVDACPSRCIRYVNQGEYAGGDACATGSGA